MKRVLGALVLGLAVYELIALVDRQRGDTISEVVWELTTRRPLVPFALGLLMGHFFWQEANVGREGHNGRQRIPAAYSGAHREGAYQD